MSPPDHPRNEHDDEEAGGHLGPEEEAGLSRLVKGPLHVRSTALTVLLALAVLYTAYLARPFFVPAMVALILKLLLTPLVRGLRRLGIHPAIGAALVLLSILGLLGSGIFALATPAAEWIEEIPQILDKLKGHIEEVKRPMEEVSKATQEVKKVADVDDGREPLFLAQMDEPGFVDRLFSGAWILAVNGVMAVILLYFLLAADEIFLLKLVQILPRMEDKKLAVQTVRVIEHQISTFLLLTTVINILLGVAVGIALYLLGMPNPILWGAMVGLLNYMPYIGPFVGYVVIALVAFEHFDTLTEALLPPLAYFVINFFEGMLITPTVAGRRLTLSPVAIFAWLMLWSWLWGAMGALMAVPMLVGVKIVCDNLPSLQPFARFLGR